MQSDFFLKHNISILSINFYIRNDFFLRSEKTKILNILLKYNNFGKHFLVFPINKEQSIFLIVIFNLRYCFCKFKRIQR